NHYGACVEEAPQVFSFKEDGSLLIQTYDVPPDLETKVRDACMMCPTQSVQIEEE
ncbi:MAG: ferredoxin, partial [Deltaproteobacteria bacterium]|nr:ferredoxin [Deltaproteobacteria bacterium]